MKILHCADLHLDSRLSAHLPREKARERRDELLVTFTRMADYADGCGAAAVLIAGDLFDTRHVSPRTRNVVLSAFRAHPEIAFFYLRGNHDRDDLLEGPEAPPENLYLFGEKWRSYPLGETAGGRAVTVTGAEPGGEDPRGLYDALDLRPEDVNIVLLHGQAAERAAAPGEEIVPLPALRGKHIDYLALGHIHRYHAAPLDDRGRYCSPGCLEGRGFDECGPRGFVLLDLDGERGTFTETFVPFACRTLHEVEADVTGCGTTGEMEAAVRARLSEEGIPPEDMVKIVLTGRVEPDCEKDPVFLTARFSREYYFAKVTDRTEPGIDWSRCQGDASLKGEFIRAAATEELRRRSGRR